jgi:lipoyl(octanoyl) transferase
VNDQQLHIHTLGCQPYTQVWQRMQATTTARTADTPDALWLCTHPATFTQGQAGKPEHIKQLGSIPLVQTDRGGQVTYHGPGQLIVYPLINLTRKKIGVKAFVAALEQVVQTLLADFDILAETKEGMPGLYVADKKIASLGLKIKQGCSYHGIALNIDMNLEPFERITPCGLSGMTVTQWREHAALPDWSSICDRLTTHFCQLLNYTHITRYSQESPWHCPTSP